VTPILHALLAALFYALGIPASKLLLRDVGPATLAALLYLGAGIGIGLLSLPAAARSRKAPAAPPLSRRDLPFVAGMILLDVAAPVLLMLGLRTATSANASLLGNFEIVATAAVALFAFREPVSGRLWTAIALIVAASLLLSVEGGDAFRFSRGSLLVLAATACWGVENNCTRAIASKNTHQIVALKGYFTGLGVLAIALLRREPVPGAGRAAAALALGFVAYGLSIFLYVRAQNALGAAKTSAFYAVAPFAGAFLSFAWLGESLSRTYLAALAVMVAGAALVVVDTLFRRHTHPHRHAFAHRHGGRLHTHVVVHEHDHLHLLTPHLHAHLHPLAELERGAASAHAGTPSTHHPGSSPHVP
jgi:drug/metabolite transporter (DMT)-like permease